MNNINKANKENKCQIIKNYDLLYNKYDVNILEQNVDHLNKRFLICTQNLTAEFCVKYILNLNIELGSEDSYIYDINYIDLH